VTETVTLAPEVPAEEEISETIAISTEAVVTEDISEAITIPVDLPKQKEEVSIEATIAPKFLSDLKSQEVTEGDTVTFEVSVTGTPKPEVTW
jgi:hypothetical protein